MTATASHQIARGAGLIFVRKPNDLDNKVYFTELWKSDHSAFCAPSSLDLFHHDLADHSLHFMNNARILVNAGHCERMSEALSWP
jgi:hypothetical protein